MYVLDDAELRRLKMELETPFRLNTMPGRQLSSRRGAGTEYIGARPWQPGDRRIDVRSTVRTGELHARVYTHEYAEYALIVADGDTRLEWGGSDALLLKSELVRAAADGIGHLLSWQDDHTGMLFAGNRLQQLPIGKASAKTMRNFITTASPGDTSRLGNALNGITAMKRPRPTLVIVISDFFADGWQTPLRTLSRQCSVVPMQVTDPWDFNIPKELGHVVIGGKRYNFADVRVRDQYQQAAAENQQQIDAFFKAVGYAPMHLTTDQKLLDQFKKTFRRDGHPARRRAA